ncbi:MAG: hypothetical protein K5990_07215 [Oscillospiraceae bacterium]|nr:hypothetical protein [Oscillospiraceae bacterium]
MGSKRTLLGRTRRSRGCRVGKYQALPKWLDWEQLESRPRQEGRTVVKGTSKRVVVVKSPDPKVFEQALFIVREEYAGTGGSARHEILREAQEVADRYLHSVSPPGGRRRSRLRLILCLVGALLLAGGAAAVLYLLQG